MKIAPALLFCSESPSSLQETSSACLGDRGTGVGRLTGQVKVNNLLYGFTFPCDADPADPRSQQEKLPGKIFLQDNNSQLMDGRMNSSEVTRYCNLITLFQEQAGFKPGRPPGFSCLPPGSVECEQA